MSPIIGLTDSVTPAFSRIGKLRKGGEAPRDKDGKVLKMGEDLTFFRFTSERPEVAAAFEDAYGKAPVLINAYLPYAGVEDNFSCWREKWAAGGLQHRCDGVTETIWLGSDGKYNRTPRPCDGGCDEVGRLSLIIPELIRAGFVGYVSAETHGLHDLMSIQASLMAAWDARLGNPLGLRGILWTLRRVKEKVSTPGKDGKRIRRDKWLVKLEPAADWVQLQLQQAHNATMMLAGPSGQPVQTPENGPAEHHIDRDSGEIIDSSAHEIDNEMPEPPDEPEPTPPPASEKPAVPTATPQGSPLEDWTAEINRAHTLAELDAVAARIRAATMLTAEMREALKPIYKDRKADIEAAALTPQMGV